ncbi:hypothetical protein F4780DRAFT_776354 [Xylariomycetidae sp. FL0641]|nr:hypothetical protein F4780DRAFT_776354 [Xylariomycetidae sp. FL0641]
MEYWKLATVSISVMLLLLVVAMCAWMCLMLLAIYLVFLNFDTVYTRRPIRLFPPATPPPPERHILLGQELGEGASTGVALDCVTRSLHLPTMFPKHKVVNIAHAQAYAPYAMSWFRMRRFRDLLWQTLEKNAGSNTALTLFTSESAPTYHLGGNIKPYSLATSWWQRMRRWSSSETTYLSREQHRILVDKMRITSFRSSPAAYAPFLNDDYTPKKAWRSQAPLLCEVFEAEPSIVEAKDLDHCTYHGPGQLYTWVIVDIEQFPEYQTEKFIDTLTAAVLTLLVMNGIQMEHLSLDLPTPGKPGLLQAVIVGKYKDQIPTIAQIRRSRKNDRFESFEIIVNYDLPLGQSLSASPWERLRETGLPCVPVTSVLHERGSTGIELGRDGPLGFLEASTRLSDYIAHGAKTTLLSNEVAFGKGWERETQSDPFED